jgi:hypothetical protein
MFPIFGKAKFFPLDKRWFLHFTSDESGCGKRCHGSFTMPETFHTSELHQTMRYVFLINASFDHNFAKVVYFSLMEGTADRRLFAHSASQSLKAQLKQLSEFTLQLLQREDSVLENQLGIRFAFDVLGEHSWPTSILEPFFSAWNREGLEWSFALNKGSIRELVAAAEMLELTCERTNHALLDARRLLLLCGPANYTRWNATKQHLATVFSPGQEALLLAALVEELHFTSLVLGKVYKLGEVWTHRLWLWNRIVPLLRSQLCSDDQTIRKLQGWIDFHDNRVLDDALHNHPMNLNAWQYRRQMISLCSGNLLFPLAMSMVSPETPAPRLTIGTSGLVVLLQSHSKSAINFLNTHHRDASCSRFLVDLLTCSGSIDHNDEVDNGEANFDSLVASLWASLMRLSSRLLTQTFASGHECLWHLRLGLIAFALCRPARKKKSLCGNWTVRDEFDFVDAHAGSCVCTESTAAVSDRLDLASCSGSLLFHQWHAARYGLQLIHLLNGV